MRELHPDNIRDLALGAAVLGTGGGGDPYIGMLMAIHAIEEFGVHEVCHARAVRLVHMLIEPFRRRRPVNAAVYEALARPRAAA